MFDSSAADNPHLGQQVRTIKKWVRQAFEFERDEPVMVSEVHCTEPSSTRTETVVAFSRARGCLVLYRMAMSVAEIRPHHISSLLVMGLRAGHHPRS